MKGPTLGVSLVDKIDLLIGSVGTEFENDLEILSSLGSLKTARCDSLLDPGDDARDSGGVEL